MIRASIEKLGHSTIDFTRTTGMMGIFLFQCLVHIAMPPYKVFPIIKQINFIGNRSVIVILLPVAMQREWSDEPSRPPYGIYTVRLP